MPNERYIIYRNNRITRNWNILAISKYLQQNVAENGQIRFTVTQNNHIITQKVCFLVKYQDPTDPIYQGCKTEVAWKAFDVDS